MLFCRLPSSHGPAKKENKNPKPPEIASLEKHVIHTTSLPKSNPRSKKEKKPKETTSVPAYHSTFFKVCQKIPSSHDPWEEVKTLRFFLPRLGWDHHMVIILKLCTIFPEPSLPEPRGLDLLGHLSAGG